MSAQRLNLSGVTYRHMWAAQAIKVAPKAHTQILLKFLRHKLFPQAYKIKKAIFHWKFLSTFLLIVTQI